MEQELGNLDEIGDRVAFAENAVNYLQDSGLLRRDDNGNFHEVNNWQEHQHLLKEISSSKEKMASSQ